MLIPQHKSDAKIQGAGGQLQGGGAISSSKQAQRGAVQAIEQAQDKLLQIKDFRQTSEANAFAFEKLNGLKQQSQTDSEMDISVYQKEMDKIGSDAAKNITGELSREDFMVNFNRQAQATKWGIDNDFRKKEIASTIAINKYNKEILINSSPKMDDASKMSAFATFKKQVDRSVELGIYTREAGNAELASTQAAVNQAEADYDSIASPEQFLANDRDDYDIADDEYQKAKKKASDTITQNEAVAKKQKDLVQIENESKLALNLSEKKVEDLGRDEKADLISTISQMMVSGTVSTNFGQAYIDMITSPSSADANVKTYKGIAQYAEAIFASKDEKTKRDAVIRFMKENRDGKLSIDKISAVLKTAYESGDDVKDNFIANTIGWFKSKDRKEFDKQTEGKTKEEKKQMNTDRMSYDFLAGIADGKDPEKAKADAVDNEQIRVNPDRSSYSVGDEVDTPLGLMYVHGYYPDGEPDVRPEKPNK